MMVKSQFQVGQTVLVRDLEREDGLSGHMRAPNYCRGLTGVVERICGSFGNPESLAYGGDGKPLQALYRVRFKQMDLWDGYKGAAQDSIDIEVYEHWLKAA